MDVIASPKSNKRVKIAPEGAHVAAQNGGSRPVSPILGHHTSPERKAARESLNQGPTLLTVTDEECSLFLESTGTEIKGYSFGARVSIAGEVVFNTGMVGYPEALTDPSYSGQILVLTYPLVGNYGVPGGDIDPTTGLPDFYESQKLHIRGLIVSNYTDLHSHWNAKQSLGEWLKKNNIPAMYGVDTRNLTKILRERGCMLGKIQFSNSVIPYEDPNKINLVASVSIKTPTVFNKGGKPRILAYDCGTKLNIIRYFVNILKVELTVVPYDFQMNETVYDEFDGIFISNGPGNPEMAGPTIEALRVAMKLGEKPVPPRRTKPIFGICLGNQILALAAGAKTYKLKYGNRGLNQPCIDLRTTRCYITPQNHGYAVDNASLSSEWRCLFMNANDLSNEGIIHVNKPYFSAQFHPEANGGPTDTSFLFHMFLQSVRENRPPLTIIDPVTYHPLNVRKVLLLGSGGLSIGQAGEFDYSGSQAIKALKEENLEVVLINPNIATVQTQPGFADHVYYLPLTLARVTEVIKKERPDAIIVSMGGQTALNCGCQLHDAGVLDEYNVRVLGTQISVIKATEDRELFARKLAEINEYCAKSESANNMEEALAVAERIGYPCLVRAAYALGGLGSGFAANKTELIELVSKAFAVSDQILIDEDLRGWKEIEYEVVRDCMDNCITVCNMENFDPLGIHTGDSIVVAPSQTLSNAEYFKLRSVALKVVRHLGVVGECNIQYALDPNSERYCIIEVNARLSRSSALASKATGYPLAYVAAKLSLGKDLVKIRNSVTKTTTACFEPALDYLVMKMPRWDLKKFSRVSNRLGSSMKSVGEVMAIGRSFEEIIQKAVRMIDPSMTGFDSSVLDNNVDYLGDHQLDSELKNPTYLRLFCVARALEKGYTVDRLYDLTKIDRFYLSKLKRIVDMRFQLEKFHTLASIDRSCMRLLKSYGFSDATIGKCVKADEVAVRRRRVQNLGIIPFVKQIDTLSAEFPAQTNYLYCTYNATHHDLDFEENGVIVLGGGAYSIGSSVEFDWCSVSALRTLRQNSIPCCVINCNPETVSTDYDESDRLYFEELTFERVLDIYEVEQSRGLIVSVGGQIPNNLSLPLSRQGCTILGTDPTSIDIAEDRNKFSALCDRLGIDQAPWTTVTDLAMATRFADEVGYPVLVRPSYVLSGAAMRVCSKPEHLKLFLESKAAVNAEHPVVISKFIVNAKEVEFDGVAQKGNILNYAISEHVENAGVHSGDATLVLPAQKLYVETIRQVKRIAGNIARELNISGPFNMQFMSKNNEVKVIECNLRASRTFPFVSKTFQTNFIDLATRVMTGLPAVPKNIKLLDLDYVGVKAPIFSFTRLQGADPTLGVEMASTGEVACYGQDVNQAFLLAMLSTGFKLPTKKRTILLSVGPLHAKEELVESVKTLSELGYTLYGTPGTSDYYQERGIAITSLSKGGDENSVIDTLKRGEIELVINIPDTLDTDLETAGYRIRRTTVDYGIGLITNTKIAIVLSNALQKVKTVPCLSIEDIYSLGEPTFAFTKPTTKRASGGSFSRPRSMSSSMEILP